MGELCCCVGSVVRSRVPSLLIWKTNLASTNQNHYLKEKIEMKPSENLSLNSDEKSGKFSSILARIYQHLMLLWRLTCCLDCTVMCDFLSFLSSAFPPWAALWRPVPHSTLGLSCAPFLLHRVLFLCSTAPCWSWELNISLHQHSKDIWAHAEALSLGKSQKAEEQWWAGKRCCENGRKIRKRINDRGRIRELWCMTRVLEVGFRVVLRWNAD